MEVLASEAARQLGITALLGPNAPNPEGVLDHFERCELYVEEEDIEDPDAEFNALALEIVDELIEFAATEAQLRDAIQWAVETWPEGAARASAQRDPVALLALLSLIYIARAGAERYHGDKEREPLWTKIRDRVRTLV